MQTLKKGLAVLFMLAVSMGALGIQARADDESSIVTESITQGEESESNESSTAEEASIQSRAVPSGYADMRVGKMTDDGFIKSDGIYAEYYYSARWQGQELTSSDTTLALGQITYCINPDIPLVGEAGDEAYGWIGSKDVIRNLTSSRITTKGVIFRMLGRILQVGGTDLQNGADLAGNAAEGTKYVATQMIIWQIVWGDMDAQFNLLGNAWKKFGWEGMKYYNTAPAGGKSVKAWYDQWVAELKNSKKVPSFAATASTSAPTHQMTGSSLTLTDTNNVLQYMRITPSDSSVKLTVFGNQLKIENPNNVDFSVTMTNTICEGAQEPTPIVARRLSDGATRQTTIVASTTTLDDPVQGFFKIKAAPNTGDLTIYKVDAVNPATKLAGVRLLLEKKVYYLETETVPSGSQQDANGFFRWETVSEQTTGDGGKALWGDLTVGEYRLTETKAVPGYQLLIQPVYFELPYTKEGSNSEGSYVEKSAAISQEFTIGDQPIYAMPSSGGMEAWWYIGGFALCAVGTGSAKQYIKINRGKRNED